MAAASHTHREREASPPPQPKWSQFAYCQSVCAARCARETNFNGKYPTRSNIGCVRNETLLNDRQQHQEKGKYPLYAVVLVHLSAGVRYVRVARLLHIQITARGPPKIYPGVGTCRAARLGTSKLMHSFIYPLRVFDVGLMQFQRLAHHTPRRAQWAIWERAHRSFRVWVISHLFNWAAAVFYRVYIN